MEAPPERALRMIRAINEGGFWEELERIETEKDEVTRMIYYRAFAKFVGILWGDLKDVEGYEERREAALEALKRANEIASRVDPYRRRRNYLHQVDSRIDLDANPEEYFEKILQEADEMDDAQLMKASEMFARVHRFKESKHMAEKIKDDKKREAALSYLKFRMLFG